MISRHKTIRGRLLVWTYHATLPISLWKPLVFWCPGATYRSSDPCMPTYSPRSMHPLIPIFRSLMSTYSPSPCIPLYSWTNVCVPPSPSYAFYASAWLSPPQGVSFSHWQHGSCSLSPTVWTDTVVILNIRTMYSKHSKQGLTHSSSINTSQSNGKVMDAVTNINRSDHF